MWDRVADVVVVGYGAAGSSAAITACDLGATVLILEKNPEGGGNTKYSGGSIRTYTDLEKAAQCVEILCEGTTGREIIRAFVEESAQNEDWLTALGGDLETAGISAPSHGFPVSLPSAVFPFVPGADGIGPRLRVKGGEEPRGRNLWRVLSENVAKRRIPVLLSTAARRLLTGESREVTGVLAASPDGELRIRARRAVILCCGGFESDRSMHLNYFGQVYYALGNPGNNGDGIRLAAEMGADFWHMNAAAACFGYRVPDYEPAILHWMPHPGFVYVDQTCRRFMDEAGTDMHAVWSPVSYVDMKTLRQPRIPSYVIFDEVTRTRGPVASTQRGEIAELYQWSQDNQAEIEKGWIVAAQTLGELAAKLGLEPKALEAEIERYRSYCAQGYDPDFGRGSGTLAPIGRPPFYGVALWPSLFNTQGGPRRSARARVLDVWGQPIGHLYSAGELGSLWHRNYAAGGNIAEALAFGRIAGKNAAGERALAAG